MKKNMIRIKAIILIANLVTWSFPVPAPLMNAKLRRNMDAITLRRTEEERTHAVFNDFMEHKVS